MGKGGPRHTAKPFVEQGLLQECLRKHEDIVSNLRGYEGLSRNSAVDPRGLVHALPLVEDLLHLEPQCELHPQPLRNGLLQLLTETPSLNGTAVTGSAWVNLRCERINVLLFHVRRLARGGMSSTCAAALTTQDFHRLKAVLGRVVGKALEADGQKEKGNLPLRKGTEESSLVAREEPDGASSKSGGGDHKVPLEKGLVPVDKGPVEAAQPTRRVRVQVSDVSLDSSGFPSALKSTPSKSPRVRIFHKRPGQRAAELEEKAVDEAERARMGFSSTSKVTKRPAARSEEDQREMKKRPAARNLEDRLAVAAAAGGADPAGLEEEGPWLKLVTTNAKNPERTYLCGYKRQGAKPRLVVEVSKARSRRHCWIIEKIKDALEQEHLTKKAALSLRDKFCAEYP